MADRVVARRRLPEIAVKSPFDLFLFSTDTVTIRRAVAGGVAGAVVDWERVGKAERQSGFDTQINDDTVDDLRRVRDAVSVTLICRLNRLGPESSAEIESAIDAGADEVLLPMVRDPSEVEAVLERAAGRCQVGFLVETTEAVARIAEFAGLPVSRVYLGLVDLSIERRSPNVFSSLVDGTVDRVREAVEAPFGFGGLTLPESGTPIPCRLLIAEMARLDCGFSFLRRSFLADTRHRDASAEVPRILDAVAAARLRADTEVARDRESLLDLVGLWSSKNAVS